MFDNHVDEFYMMEAIKEAKKAEKLERSSNWSGHCLKWGDYCKSA